MAVLSQKVPIDLHSTHMEHSEAGNILPAIEGNTGEGQNRNNNERAATESPRLVLPAVKALSGLRSPGTSSTESITHLLGHSDKAQPTVKSKIKDLRGQVQLAFEELNAITTHDDNLEKQYKETVDENVKLSMSLERARREIRHLRGQLSILQMTQKEIREERARKEKSYNQRMQYLYSETEAVLGVQCVNRMSHDRDIQESRKKRDVPSILSLQERSRTVNAQGKYIEHSKKKSDKGHRRHTTYPVAAASTSPQRKALQETLPPPLSGCSCSMCNAVQSLGALTLSSSGSMTQRGHVSSSGQQILRGDRVIIKGEKPGTVKYIGRLEGGISNEVYIGVQLDAPVGFNDGEFKGKQYFHCAPNHGVFIMPSDVICVVSRRVQKTPRGSNKERLLTSNEILNRSRNKSGKGDVKMRFQTRDDDGRITITPSVYSIDEKMNEMTRAAYLMEEELKKVTNRNPGFVGSSADMSRRIETLHIKNKRKVPRQPATISMSPRPSESPVPVRSTQSSAPPTQSPREPSSPVHTAQSLAPPRPSSPAAKALNESPTSGSKKLPADVETDEPNQQALLTESLLEVLREKDLGTTGFVTIKEFVSCLAACDIEGLGKLTETEAEELLASLGMESDTGAGIAYDEVAPYVVRALM